MGIWLHSKNDGREPRSRRVGAATLGAMIPTRRLVAVAAALWLTPAPPAEAADEAAGVYGGCGPRLNEESDPEYWLSQPGSPRPALENERPPAETIPYDELVARWQEG